jgi:hypothetical protein
MSTADVTERIQPSASRVLYRLLGGVAGVALVLWGAWSLLSLAARDEYDVRSSYPDVRSLVVRAGSGKIELRSSPAGTPLTVTEHVVRSFESPTRTNTISGHELRLSSECDEEFAGSCNVRYAITVPRGTSVMADSGAGDVVADGVVSSMPVELSSGAGDVVASDVTAPRVKLDSGAGDVIATALRVPELRATSSAGSVRIDFAGKPPRDVFADSSAGDVSISLPDATYALQASTSAGNVSTGSVRNDPRSPRSVTATSSAGDVVVDTAP